jgi:hypothetical protein
LPRRRRDRLSSAAAAGEYKRVKRRTTSARELYWRWRSVRVRTGHLAAR